MHSEWKISENLQWLEERVKNVIKNEKQRQKEVNDHKIKYLFQKTFYILIFYFINSKSYKDSNRFLRKYRPTYIDT